jgi:kumamolisin
MNRYAGRVRIGAVAVFCAAAFAAIAIAASSSPRASVAAVPGSPGSAGGTTVNGANQEVAPLRGNRPVATDRMRSVGFADPDKQLALEITLELRNRSALKRLLAELQDPKSPRYHHWLTPKEFTDRFGPRPSDVKAVSGWLRSKGFHVTETSLGKRSIRFSGSVSVAGRAFSTDIATFGDGKLYGPTKDPMIPARFIGAIGYIGGLDNMGHVLPQYQSPVALRPSPLSTFMLFTMSRF